MNNPSSLVAYLEKDFKKLDIEDKDELKEILKAGLNWETNYWIDCALNWIENGFELDKELVEILEKISTNKNNPQKTRQRAFAYAKK